MTSKDLQLQKKQQELQTQQQLFAINEEKDGDQLNQTQKLQLEIQMSQGEVEEMKSKNKIKDQSILNKTKEINEI